MTHPEAPDQTDGDPSSSIQTPSELVLLEVVDGLATIVLNRPERKNALIGPLSDALAAAFTTVADLDDVGVVLLHGAGGGFCSGLDLKEYGAEPPPDWLPTASASLVSAHRAIADCPVPVVGALERFAINGGAAFALACDLLVVGREAFLQVGEVRQGMPAAMNLAWLLERHPLLVAHQLTLTGRRFTGPELQRLGIALDVVPDDEVLASARNLARELAGFPTGAGRTMKAHAAAMVAPEVGGVDRIGRGAALLAAGGRLRPGRA